MTHALRKFTTSLLLACCGAASAHEGHHHDEADEAPAPAAAAPHAAPDAPRLEVVAQREGADLVFYVDDYASNAPLDGLQLSLRSGTRTLEAAGGQGRYALPAELLEAPAGQDLQLRVQGGGIDVTVEVPLPAVAAVPPVQEAPSLLLSRLSSAALILAMLLAAWLLRRRRAAHGVAEAGTA
jgi:hypothetical protein